ncbi:hypothetical protein BC826DRAFT_967453 [Russula brevipes]|nr:hypothetical protein BC826DRAFT_967453 [Russula brevipes]
MTRPIQDTLDSTIRDAVGFLSTTDKADVLLCTMERLALNDKITAGLSHAALQGLVFRRFSVKGLHLTFFPSYSADLQAILLLDPNHCEAKDLLSHLDGETQKGAGNVVLAGWNVCGHLNPKHGSTARISDTTYNAPHLSVELWREIVSYLSRRDLRSLVSVPHVLSSIARQFLFRDVTLHLGTGKWDADRRWVSFDPDEIDKWHAWRSAEILRRLNSDATYASQVRSLTIWAPQLSEDTTSSWFMVMLPSALEKLVNLKIAMCTIGRNALAQVLEMLEKSHPDLQELTILTDSPTLPSLPKFCQLRSFVFGKSDKAHTIPDIRSFLTAHAVALRTLTITNKLELGPPQEVPLSINNLRNLTLCLAVSRAHCVRLLLENGQQLENLQLGIHLKGCVLSNVLRSFPGPCSFPLLRKFSFTLQGADRDDPDLFPAVAEIVRGHPTLEALMVICETSGDFGYDAAIWGVMPSLICLRVLSMDVPADLPLSLCGWLVPRTVVALRLHDTEESDIYCDGSISRTSATYCDELLPGLPTGLKFLALPELEDLGNDPSLLPALRLVYSSGILQTFCPIDREFTDLGERQRDYYMHDWLVQLNCEEAEFIFPVV